MLITFCKLIMGETKVGSTSQVNDRNRKLNLIDPAFSKFITHTHLKLQTFLKSHLKGIGKGAERKDAARQVVRKDHKSSVDWEADLKTQMQLWRQNPYWVDQPPVIDVTVPKGSLCNLYAKVDVGLPPDAIYNIVTDPDNKRVFKNIKDVISRKVLVDEGSRQVVELEQAAIWKFIWWSGTISVHVIVDQNREDHSMRFKQVNTGFMKKFEGCWRVEPIFVDEKICYPFRPKTLSDYQSCTGGRGRIGSRVSLEQLLEPAIIPPPPISWYLRGITSKTTETLINYMIEEVARIKGFSEATDGSKELKSFEDASNSISVDQIRDIKKRWALHRRNALQFRKK
ncbi:uncharacterized protein LOC141623439 isoform X2 [Silene latifolia]|uniref:uncharacterized protein LOC141623439 isoform X2 n=1 Tax=Silene latifolia TaxID=37657 RepID=UPI003D77CC51